ncbi:ATP-dependent (S)-NAD(P)H-hydrate dehydratase [Spatholobus suberectus]|nr:ATP-dependent (S)-NAD(P)H-hydrate dehydratase [Spatholobus suberectus]
MTTINSSEFLRDIPAWAVDDRDYCLLMLMKDGMNSRILLDYAKSCILASSSPVFRRQQFLIRCVGGSIDHQPHSRDMQALRSLEVDSESVIRAITPALDPTRHKGQAGNIAVIGGCREYTGAPYFAAISALKIGADLSHVFCTKDAASVIKSYSPELIVHPVLEESYNVGEEYKRSISSKVLAEVDKWMERFDCLVVGPGLGRDPFLLDCVSEIIRHARQSNIPIVIDGDGLFLVTNNIDLVSGYALAVLTPNVNEYKRLVQKVLSSEVNDVDASQQLQSLAKQIGGVTILRKGNSDLISDGDTVKSVSIYGSPRRCGGQGDILSGSVAVFLSWARQHILAADSNSNLSCKNPTVLGCIAGSAILRKAASLAFSNKKRSTVTGDIIECLGKSLEDICPAN